mmetsp:Transcript_38042/g.107465  ORF Transcript_38042/g.107465 Transcript_38042/m.107465 type:complete len:226 (+) Transcript_38042:547-1224(+)
MGPMEYSFILAQISSYVVSLPRRQVRSTTDTSEVGTRKAMPVSLPLSWGRTLPTALAAPVEEGMMLKAAPRPPRQSLAEGPSTVFWVAVVAWTVVMRPSTRPNSWSMTLAMGARQLVVQEALDTILRSGVYFSSFTPMTNMGASGEGAVMTTLSAPPSMWAWAVARLVNTPVDSTTMEAPTSPQGRLAGSLSEKTFTAFPSIVRTPSEEEMSDLRRPWTVSYSSM